MIITIGSTNYHCTRSGYLKDWKTWTPEWAIHCAKQPVNPIILNQAHWELINFLRNHFAKVGRNPIEKALLRIISRKLGKVKGTKEYLYALFPGGADQLSRLAGLRRAGACAREQ